MCLWHKRKPRRDSGMLEKGRPIIITIDTSTLPPDHRDNLRRLRDSGIDLHGFAHYAIGELSGQPLEDEGFRRDARDLLATRYSHSTVV